MLSLRGAEAIREKVPTEELDRLWADAKQATDTLVAHIEAGGQLCGPEYVAWQKAASAFRHEAERVAGEMGLEL
jgi:hypothetical protein